MDITEHNNVYQLNINTNIIHIKNILIDEKSKKDIWIQAIKTLVPDTKNTIDRDDPHLILKWIHVSLSLCFSSDESVKKNSDDSTSNGIYEKVKKLKAFIDSTKNNILEENLLAF